MAAQTGDVDCEGAQFSHLIAQKALLGGRLFLRGIVNSAAMTVDLKDTSTDVLLDDPEAGPDRGTSTSMDSCMVASLGALLTRKRAYTGSHFRRTLHHSLIANSPRCYANWGMTRARDACSTKWKTSGDGNSSAFHGPASKMEH